MADDLSTSWKALNPQQREQAIARMTPEQKTKLASTLGYKADSGQAQANAPKPTVWETMKANFNAGTQAPPPPTGVLDALSPKRLGENLAAGVGDFVRGVPTLLHKAQPRTLDEILKTGEEETNAFYADPVGSYERAAGQGAGMLATGEALRGAAKGVGKVLPKETIRKGTQSLVGAGERGVKAEVERQAGAAQTAAKSTEESNRAALSAHDAELREAGQKNVNAHVRHLQTKAEIDKGNALAGKSVEEQNRAATSQHKQNLEEAGRKNLTAHLKFLQEKTEAENANAAARAIPDAHAGLEADITKNTKDLQAEIETAREKALKVGNEKYNTLREELNPIPADMEKIHGAYYQAAESLGETQAQPTLVTRLGKALQNNAELTYKDLQSMYSELGKELSKGTLLGPTYHAYDVMQEAIGDDMQRIANSHGEPIDTASVPRKMVDGKPTKEPAYTTAMGKQLFEARNYWRRMKQAFGKPYNPTDAGNQFLEKTSPEYTRRAETENQGRLLGSFNETIPQVAERIRSARQRQSALPSEGARPTAKVPEYPSEATVEPPKYKGPPELKAHPEYPEEVTVAPPKTSPIEVPNVNTRALREKLVDRWSSGESQLSKFQIRSLVGGGLGAILGGLFEGKVGAGVGGVLGTTLGPAAISKLVEMPAVREWLTRPPADELAALQRVPHADRITITDGLKQVVDTAQKQGKPIPVSAKIAVLLGLAPQKKRVAAALQP